MISPPLRTRAAKLGAIVAATATLVWATDARAEDKKVEAAAKQALSSAETDFLSMEYDKAIAALQKAFTACSGGKCAIATRAALLRDIGTMQFRLGKKGEATKSFGRALDLEPNLTLNPSYDAPDLRAAWRDVKGSDDPKTPQQAEPTKPTAEPEPEPDQPAEPAKRAEPGSFARFWVGVAGSIDLAILKSQNDACKLDPGTGKPAGDSGYYCTNGDGSDFPTRANRAENDSMAAGKGGNVNGGTERGSVRLLLSLDYALSENFLLGGRLGYVTASYPGQAASNDGRAWSLPLHIEFRATYLLGDAPLSTSGLSAAFIGAAGVAPYDASTRVSVSQTGTTGDRAVLAWQLSGPAFIAAGAGARMALSTRMCFTLLTKLGVAFGQSALPFASPEAGLQLGF